MGRRLASILLVVVLVIVGLAGQAMTDGMVEAGTSETGRLVGRAGFAYFSGLRTFAAAVLWNRLEPQFHGYYEGSLDRSTFMVPTLRLVTWLDPQFVEAYYLGPWILARNDLVDESWSFAMEGLERNPGSGLLIGQLAQLALIEGDVDRARVYAEQALEEGVVWRSLSEQHDTYAVLRDVFKRAGDDETHQWVLRELEWIDARLEEEIGEAGLDALHEGHDHDHDH